MQPFMSFNTTIHTLQCIQHNYSFNVNIRVIQCNHSCTIRIQQFVHLCYSIQPFIVFITAILFSLNASIHGHSLRPFRSMSLFNATIRVIQCNATILVPFIQYSPSYHGFEGSVSWQLQKRRKNSTLLSLYCYGFQSFLCLILRFFFDSR